MLGIGSAGLTVNSNLVGRVIFTGGLDVLVRTNPSPVEAGHISGGGSGGSVVVQGRKQSYETVYRFRSEAISRVTLGARARIGLDYHITERSCLLLEASYSRGFGCIYHATATNIRVDGVSYQGDYTSQCSSVQFQLGYKHSLFRVNPLSRLQFTPCNQPHLPAPRFHSTDEKQGTFKAGS